MVDLRKLSPDAALRARRAAGWVAALAAAGLAGWGALAFAVAQVDVAGRLDAAARERGWEASFESARVALWPTPHLELRGARVADPQTSKTPFLAAKRLDAWPRLLPLFSGRFVPAKIEAEGVALRLDARTPTPSKAPASSATLASLSSIDIKNGQVDTAAGPWAFATLRARVDAGAMALSGDLGRPAGPMAQLDGRWDGSSWRLDLKAPAWTAHATQGPQAWKAQFNADDVGAMLAWAGLHGASAGSGSGQAVLSKTAQGWSARDASLSWGSWNARVAADVVSGARPYVKMQASLAQAPSKPSKPGRAMNPKAAIPWGALSGVDFDAEIQASTWQAGPWSFSDVKLRPSARQGRLSAPFTAGLGAGQASGSFEADASVQQAKLSARARGEARGSTLSGFPFALEVDLNAKGSSWGEAMDSLAGPVSLRAGAGRVSSGSLASLSPALGKALPMVAGASASLDLDCVGALWRFERGLAAGDPLFGAEGPWMSIVGSGRASARAVDLGLRVHPKRGLDLAKMATLASAFRLQGPWEEPKVVVDAAAALRSARGISEAFSQGAAGVAVDAFSRKDQPNACLAVFGENTPASAAAPETPAAQAEQAAKKAVDMLRGIFQ